jgi:hypothetical protein
VVRPSQRPAPGTSGTSATSTRRCRHGRRCASTRSPPTTTPTSWKRVLHKLLLNFNWWVNRKDAVGDNLFEGGFLGLDNIGPFDRSRLPVTGVLEQSDGTAWMAMYCQDLLEMALLLCQHDAVYEDLATKFFEHFSLIGSALNDQGLWNKGNGFYYNVLRTDGESMPLRARSVVGLLPLAAVTTIGAGLGASTRPAGPDWSPT